MTQVDWKPDRKKLREFGWFSLAGFGLIGLLLGWRFGWIQKGEWLYPGIFWGIGILTALLARIEPMLIKPVYWIMTAISAVVGPIIATVMLGLVFLFVFLPIGLYFSLRGRDELRLRSLAGQKSHWLPADVARDPKQYFRQF